MISCIDARYLIGSYFWITTLGAFLAIGGVVLAGRDF